MDTAFFTMSRRPSVKRHSTSVAGGFQTLQLQPLWVQTPHIHRIKYFLPKNQKPDWRLLQPVLAVFTKNTSRI